MRNLIDYSQFKQAYVSERVVGWALHRFAQNLGYQDVY